MWNSKAPSLALVLALGFANHAGAADIIVQPGQSIQAAIDATVNGDRVLIQPGTYAETIDFKGKQIEVIGVAGAAATILDATSVGGSVAKFLSTETAQTKLAGVTLRGGTGTSWTLEVGQPPTVIGGGIVFAGGAYPVVADCVIEQNVATRGAGCVSLMSPFPPLLTPTLIGCTLRSNVAAGDGGGAFGAMRLVNCLLADNRATNGAGACNVVRAEGCTFENNEALVSGGGLAPTDHPQPGETPFVRDCTFTGNRALSLFGGAMRVIVPSLTQWTLASCRFENNDAAITDAVSIYAAPPPPPIADQVVRIESCVFAKNGTHPFDAALGVQSFTAVIQGCTFDGDRLLLLTALFNKVSSCAFVNDSTATDANSKPGVFDHCVAPFTLTGTGNILGSPQFVNQSGGNYHLLATSPCIDAGIPSYPPAPDPLNPIADLDLTPRIQGGRVDVGAHEFPTDCDADGVTDWIEIESGAEADCDGNGWIDGCEPLVDCNGNGIQDDCDIASGTASDCDQNGVPDSCQLSPGTNFDSDGSLDGCQYRLVPQEFPTIQMAINSFFDSAPVVLVDDGVFTGPGNVEIDLHGKPLTIRSRNGPERTIIECGPTHAFVSESAAGGAGQVIEGFTIRGATVKPAIRIAAVGNYVFRRCVIADNLVVGSGVISVVIDANVTFENCVIARNTATTNGAGLSAFGKSTVNLTRCTLAFNTANGGPLPPGPGGGALLVTGLAKVTATECVFAHNTAPNGPAALVAGSGSKLTVVRSLVDGGPAAFFVQGGGVVTYDPTNIAGDPLFVPVPTGDVHLTATSPCIGGGTLGGKDFEGDPTVGTSDLGADEFHPHLYAMGDFTAGATLHVTAIGPPAGGPVLVLAGTSELVPPLFTPYGLLFVAPPFLGNAPLPIAASLAPSGFATASVVLPASLPPGFPFRAQALIVGTPSVLTNLLALDS